MSIALSDGSVFASRYRIARRIAMGGMGAVYEVMHLETERRLALKVMLPHIVQSEEMRDRFRREARVAAHIESEHIVDVLDAGIDDATGMPFLVMELLRGEEISKALHRLGRFGPIDTVTILHQASLALDKTHRSYIVHRDLKPENLFLTEREDGQLRVKVLDFGIAKLLAEGSTQDPGTRSLGTPLYMAPEQFRSGQPISAATDIYALGMIAFTMLVGSSYWADEAKDSSNVFMFAGSVMAGPKELATVRARRRGVTLPAAFDAWFARTTALLPQDRFPTAGAAIAALADALAIPRPGGAFSSTGGAFRQTGTQTNVVAPAPLATPAGMHASGPHPMAASGPQGTVAMDDGATMVYSGSQPQLGTSGISASGPQAMAAIGASGPQPPPPPAMVPGAASTGSAYGSATGAVPAPSGGRGKVLAAIGVGVALGVFGIVFMVLRAGASSSGTAAASSGSAVAATATSATAVASTTPAAPSASAQPAAEAPPAATAAATEAPTTAPAKTSAPAMGKKQPPPPPATTAAPGKKTIYVRD
jgi:serine/threonine-protein kinase